MMQEHLTLHDIADYLTCLSNTPVPDATTRTPTSEWIKYRSLRCVRCDKVRRLFSGFSAPEYRVRAPEVDGMLSTIRWRIKDVLEHLLARGLHFRTGYFLVTDGAGSFDVKISWSYGRSYASVERYLNRSPIASFVRFSLSRQPSWKDRYYATKKLALHFGVEAEAIQRAADTFQHPDCRDAAVPTWRKWILRMVDKGLPPEAITLPEVTTLLKSKHAIFREMGIPAFAKVDLSSDERSLDPIASALPMSGTC